MRKDYISDSKWHEFMEFSKDLQTPCVIIDLETIKNTYQDLIKNFPYADVYYAVKANPHNEVIKLLGNLGSSFDIASRYELDKVLSLGITPDRLSYGNNKKSKRY